MSATLAQRGGLKLLFLNIHSLINKLERLEFFLGNLQSAIDVVVLAETWLLPGEEGFFGLDGYVSYHQPRNTRDTRGGGLAIFVAKHLQAVPLVDEMVGEIQFLGIKLLTPLLSVIAYYRPPNMINMYDFLTHLDRILYKYPNTILTGDSNINTFNIENLHVSQFKSVLSMNCFDLLNKPIPSEATRITEHSSTQIDHAFVGFANKQLCSLKIDESHISDHKYLQVDIKAQSQPPTSHNTLSIFDTSQITESQLNELAQYDDFDVFHEKLMRLVQIRRVTKISRRNNNKPWFTKELKSLHKMRRKFYDLFDQYPGNPVFKEQYDIYDSALTKAILCEKQKFIKKQVQENLQKPAKLWKIINNLASNTSTHPVSQTPTLLVDNNQVSEPFDVAQTFNNYFVGVSNEVKSQIHDSSNNSIYFPQKHPLQTLSSFTQTTPEEIDSIIQALPNNSSPGYDGITSSFLKQHKSFFSSYLSKSINRMFETGIFPTCLKIATVTPVFKKGSKSDRKNYRPISVLPYFSKVFETTIKNRLLEHLQQNNLISEKQYGFLKFRSTCTAATSLINQIAQSLNKRMKTSALFIDLMKAFDCLDFDRMEKILRNYGVTGMALNLLSSFIRNRIQRVKVGGVISDDKECEAGLPQGSIIIVIFLIYLNDFFGLPLHGFSQLFCDDAVLAYEALDYPTLQRQMTEDLHIIDAFFRSRFMLMNLSKTKFIIFKTKNSSTQNIFSTLSFKATAIESVESHEYLGLCIDSALAWDQHVSKVINKASPYVGLLRRLKPYLPETQLMQVYYSYIHSHLTYLLPIWGFTASQRMLAVQRIQNKAIKIIRGLPILTSTTSLYSPKLLPFTKLAEFHSILLIYKIIGGYQVMPTQILSNLTVTGRNTRQAGLLRPPNYILTVAQNTVLYKGTQMYNKFVLNPLYTPNLEINQFKTVLKTYIYEN